MQLIENQTYISPLDTYPEEEFKDRISLFLAGGITGCNDWQNLMREKLEKECPGLLLINPRRSCKIDWTYEESHKQIKWEHDYLHKVSAISFWFPSETLCPITLYELGTWTQKGKKIFIGCHEEYKRKIDVEIQTKLCRPDMVIADSIEKLSNQVKEWYLIEKEKEKVQTSFWNFQNMEKISIAVVGIAASVCLFKLLFNRLIR